MYAVFAMRGVSALAVIVAPVAGGSSPPALRRQLGARPLSALGRPPRAATPRQRKGDPPLSVGGVRRGGARATVGSRRGNLATPAGTQFAAARPWAPRCESAARPSSWQHVPVFFDFRGAARPWAGGCFGPSARGSFRKFADLVCAGSAPGLSSAARLDVFGARAAHSGLPKP